MAGFGLDMPVVFSALIVKGDLLNQDYSVTLE